MKTIHKFALPMGDFPSISMPRGAHVLSVQTQYDQPQVWAMVDTSAPMETRNFLMFGTGHAVPEMTGKHNFIGTFQLQQGRLVFHLFDAP